MKYYSTNRNANVVDFKTATIQGLAPDNGLYFPDNIPVFSKDYFENLKNLSVTEIAYNMLQPYMGKSIDSNTLTDILVKAFNFEIPLVNLTDEISVLELFHGPTLAFKDIGARFMSRCLSYFVKNENKKTVVLVATSGDTGGAVADGFFGVDGVDVVILYPKGKVSLVQEKQMAALGGNINAIEVNGDFDDCQRLVKQAFLDVELRKKIFLTSANSINISRWLPQQIFYFLGYQQWSKERGNPVVSVPSGNFGNICAGLLAKKSGLPIEHFIAACNANDVIPRYLTTGNYQTKGTVKTISNAMDVGDPSNFVRILELYQQDLTALKKDLSAYAFSDEDNLRKIKAASTSNGYFLDPHGSIGMLALEKHFQNHVGQQGFFLETAHPIKFLDTIKNSIDFDVETPEEIQELLKKSTLKIEVNTNYEEIRDLLLRF